ncbi:MAG: hypothetical protein EBT86_00795 [Actinobacteria bacterium]|nr:hypothetical protein [Actinomycetota bacterium]
MFSQYIELKDVSSMASSINILVSNQHRYARPLSLSDSFAWEPENIERAQSSNFLGTGSDKNTNIRKDTAKSFIHYSLQSSILNNIFRFLFHVTLVSIFETLFFFFYVSTLENSGIIQTINGLIGNTVLSCSILNNSERIIVNDILELFLNSSQIIQKGNEVQQNRLEYNNNLFNRAWVYVGSLGTLLGLFSIIVAAYNPNSIKWGSLILENIGLVIILALYEYMFFSTIITPYLPISSEEIGRNIVYELQHTCGLLE